MDAFIVQLSPAGTGLIYGTFLGGSENDGSYGIAVDQSGAAYVTGSTSSTNFPTTPGAFDTSFGGAFIAKLNPAGSALLYSTSLDGGGFASGIAVDSSGAAYVTGSTISRDYRTTP